jgi:hypothetical protein
MAVLAVLGIVSLDFLPDLAARGLRCVHLAFKSGKSWPMSFGKYACPPTSK